MKTWIAVLGMFACLAAGVAIGHHMVKAPLPCEYGAFDSGGDVSSGVTSANLFAPMNQWQQSLPIRPSSIPLGAYIYVDTELMQVIGFQDSTPMVIRGVNGTRSFPHANGATVFFPKSLSR